MNIDRNAMQLHALAQTFCTTFILVQGPKGSSGNTGNTGAPGPMGPAVSVIVMLYHKVTA